MAIDCNLLKFKITPKKSGSLLCWILVGLYISALLGEVCNWHIGLFAEIEAVYPHDFASRLHNHKHQDLICSLFNPSADALILTLVQAQNIQSVIKRFDHIDGSFQKIAFYGAESLSASVVPWNQNWISIGLPVENKYPPRELEMLAMDIVSQCAPRDAIYLLRLDPDSLVSPRYLEKLRSLYGNRNYSREIFGKPGKGRQHEIGRLGFPSHVSYCLGGMTVAYGTPLLHEMKGRWRPCLEQNVSNHSDTEVQLCIYNSIKISCSSPPDSAFISTLDSKARNHRLPMDTDSVLPSSVLARADVIHPLKAEEEYNRMRDAMLYQLMPPLTSQRLLRQNGGTSREANCVLNYHAQMQLSSCTGQWNGDECSFGVPRCALSSTQNDRRLSETQLPTVFVLTTRTENEQGKFERVCSRLRRAGFSQIVPVIASSKDIVEEMLRVANWTRRMFPETFTLWPNISTKEFIANVRALVGVRSATSINYLPSQKEIQYSSAHQKAIRMAILKHRREYRADMFDEFFIVVDNDIVLHKNFQKEYQKLVQEGCGLYLSQYGGLILLGSSEWQDGERWTSMVDSRFLSCYDAHDLTLGSFAVLYNEAGARMILKERSRTPNIPFDHSLYQLALQGGLVSVAVPNLVVVDHWGGEDSVDGIGTNNHEMEDRIRRNKWDIPLYDWPSWV